MIDEGWRAGSFSAEISAQIMENAFDDLDAPVARVCSAEVPMPYAKHLEAAALPRSSKSSPRHGSLCLAMAEFVMPQLGADMSAGQALALAQEDWENVCSEATSSRTLRRIRQTSR